MMVQVGHQRAEVDEAAQKDSARRDHLTGKCQLANQRQEGTFGAGAGAGEGEDVLAQLLIAFEVVIDTESSWIPRNVMAVAGPSVFSCLTGALI